MLFAVVVMVALPAHSFAVNVTSTFNGAFPAGSSTSSTETTQEDTCTLTYGMYHEGTTSPLVDTIAISLHQVFITSGPYAGWGYQRGTYTTGQGYYGNYYAVGNVNPGVDMGWGMLDDNAPGNTTGGNLNSYRGVRVGTATGAGGYLPFDKFYMTYVNGGYAHGHFDLVFMGGTPCIPANPSQSRQLIVTQAPSSPSYPLNVSGYFTGTLYPDFTLLYLPALQEGIHFGSYTDSLSNPTGIFDYHDFLSCSSGSCYANGVSEGMVFGAYEYTMTMTTTGSTTIIGAAEEALAVAGSGTVTVNPIPSVSVTGNIGNQNIVTAVQTTAVNLTQPNFQIATSNGTPILVYDISVSNPSSVTGNCTICLNYDPYTYNPAWQIYHESPAGSGYFISLATTWNQTDHTLCAQTPSFSLFAVGTPTITGETPTATFTYSKNGLTVSFNASGSFCPSGNCTYAWTFAGGNPSFATTVSAQTVYATGGTKTVTLTVTDVTNFTQDMKTASITVSAPATAPTCDFTPTFTAGANPNVSVAETVSTDVTKQAILWGDGSVAETHDGNTWSPLTHNYTVAGTYNISLKVKNAAGLTCSVKHSIGVTVAKYSISGTVTATPGPVPVSGATVTITGTNYNRTFYTNSSGQYTTYATLKPGTYHVTVTKSGYTFPAGVDVTVGPNEVNNVAGTRP